MNRQLIMGSLFGVVLGAFLTSSMAYGVFTADATAATPRGAKAAVPAPAALTGSLSDYGQGQPPLRPGSRRIGPDAAPELSAEIPVALDAQSAESSPTV